MTTRAADGDGPRLRVVAWDGPELGDDKALSEAVGRLAGLEAAFEARVGCGDDCDGLEAALRLASSTEDPVLVLPGRGRARQGASSRRPKVLRRILVPMDRSVAERSVLRAWIARAQSFGSAVDQLHVLTEGNRPAMWEGAGHHAAAWHDELRRRYLAGDASLVVRRGDPIEHVTAAEPRADLVVSCWGGDLSQGRARILRRLLERASVPVLLVRTPPADSDSRLRPAHGGPAEGPGTRRRAS